MTKISAQINDLYQTKGRQSANAAFHRAQEENDLATVDLLELAVCATEYLDYATAETILRKLISNDSKNTQLRNRLANLLIRRGDFDAAQVELSIALENNAKSGETYFNLSQIKKLSASDPIIDRLESNLRSDDLTQNDEYASRLALGKFYDDIEQYDNAFKHFDTAKKMAPIEYNHNAHREYFERVKAACNSDLMEAKRGNGHNDKSPIFIVGMPRTGSSLLETLLAKNTGLVGIGERAEFPLVVHQMEQEMNAANGFADILPLVTSDILKKFGAQYISRTELLAPRMLYRIDKNLLNFHRCGLIDLYLPQATIIHSRRNIFDTCLSCYFQSLDPSMFSYSFSLENIAAYFSTYANLMSHWDRVMPDRIINVDYESVIKSPKEEIHAIVNNMDGVKTGGDEAAEIVATSSAWQARQPIYESSIERWRNYEAHLAPLFEALERHGVLSDQDTLH